MNSILSIFKISPAFYLPFKNVYKKIDLILLYTYMDIY